MGFRSARMLPAPPRFVLCLYALYTAARMHGLCHLGVGNWGFSDVEIYCLQGLGHIQLAAKIQHDPKYTVLQEFRGYSCMAMQDSFYPQ